MQSITQLHSLEDYNAMLEHSHNHVILLLKHSNSCPVSAMGYSQFEGLHSHNLPLYMVVVQEQRELSQHIAEHLAITHQSPQVIFIKNASPQKDVSHYNIRTDKLLESLDDLSANNAL